MRRVIMPRSRWGRVLRLALVLIVVMFALFEIGIRLLQPDAVHYDIHFYPYAYGTVPHQASGTITDPAMVAQWQATMNLTTNGRFIWQTGDTCSESSGYDATYVFLWHGWPIEVVSQLQSCVTQFEISSGGIPDLRAYQIEGAIQP